jgi:hypothetical protein
MTISWCITHIHASEMVTMARKTQKESDIMWKFKRIISHEGPLQKGHPEYRNSQYNVMIEWENGEISKEPLKVIAADDPVTCAIYAREHNLLDTPGWKHLKHIAKREKKFTRTVNQSKLRSCNTAPRYKYGFEALTRGMGTPYGRMQQP